MEIKHRDTDEAVKAGLITEEQARKLWLFWEIQNKDVPRFRFIHILYYLGGLIAISAVTLYVTNAWENVRGYPLLILAILLFLIGLGLTHYFLNKQLRIPAGIMATFSLALVPLIVYNIEFLFGMSPPTPLKYSDFHYLINWFWVNMEIATIIVGVIMIYFYRFPFLLFPIAVVLWYMSMDLWPLLVKMHEEYTFNDQAQFSMFFGLFILLIAVIIDFTLDDEKEDFAFWLYIAGAVAFWGGLSCQYSHSELSKFFYLLINVAMLFLSAILNRRVFAIFGVLGILGYLSHLAFDVFSNSLGFPIVLIFIGILIIFAAAFFTRIESKINATMRPFIPKKILKKMDVDLSK